MIFYFEVISLDTNGQFIKNSLSAGNIFELEEVKKTVEITSNTSEKIDNYICLRCFRIFGFYFLQWRFSSI